MGLVWSWANLVVVIVTLIAAPLIGGILNGFDRKLTAHMQGRIGPPIVQPFYDVIKLWQKERIAVNRIHLVWAWSYLVLVIASLMLLVLRQDLLVLLFTLAFASISLILGAYSVKSPYSNVGAYREIMQLFAYEPVLILAAVAIYLRTGSFMISEIFRASEPLLAYFPLVFIALLVVLTIKMRKSPFDIAASHHAHQEIVRGILTEYSGKYLALIEIAHWYELILVLGLISLFWANPIWAGILIALGAFFVELVVDNSTARVTWPWMLKFVWSAGIGLAILNIAGLLAVAY